jgi:ABC-type long-subunit fatty acid transport system fused permease/ATPase subunit
MRHILNSLIRHDHRNRPNIERNSLFSQHNENTRISHSSSWFCYLHLWGCIIYELGFKSVVIHKSYNHFISQDIFKRTGEKASNGYLIFIEKYNLSFPLKKLGWSRKKHTSLWVPAYVYTTVHKYLPTWFNVYICKGIRKWYSCYNQGKNLTNEDLEAVF